MKTKLFALGLCAMVAFASCSKSDDDAPAKPEFKGASQISENCEATGSKEEKAEIKLAGWSTFKETGELTWYTKGYDNDRYFEVTAYQFEKAGDNTTWLVSPALNNTDAKTKNVVFDIQCGFWVNESPLKVYVMTDSIPSKGNPIEVAGGNPLTSSSVINGWYTANIDLSKYSGKIYIGFKFSGNNGDKASSTFRIDNFRFNYEKVKGDAIDNPLTVDDVIKNESKDKSCKWVKGYVVGFAVTANGGFAFKPTIAATDVTNIIIAPTAAEKNPANCIVAKLPKGTPQTELSLGKNPTLIGKEVSVKGMLTPAYSKPGMAGIAEFKK